MNTGYMADNRKSNAKILWETHRLYRNSGRLSLCNHICFPLNSKNKKSQLSKNKVDIGGVWTKLYLQGNLSAWCLANAGKGLFDWLPLGGGIIQKAICFNEGQFTNHFSPECASPQMVLLHIPHYRTMHIVPLGKLQSRALCSQWENWDAVDIILSS